MVLGIVGLFTVSQSIVWQAMSLIQQGCCPMKFTKIRSSSEDYFKHLLKRYRITKIDNQSCLLVSRRTNMTWKIDILSSNKIEA